MKRFYGGCSFVDVAEKLAIERAKEDFQCKICECTTSFRFQQANMGVYKALIKCNVYTWNET